LLVGETPGQLSTVRKYEYSIDRKDPLPTAKQQNPNLSDRINEAIVRGMAIEPQNRPKSMEEWLKLLKFIPIETNETPTQILNRDSKEVFNPVSQIQPKQEPQTLTDGSAWKSQNQLFVIRGGSWQGYPDFCRSPSRSNGSKVVRDNGIGFRVVCVASRNL
jgi:hypothetical protein